MAEPGDDLELIRAVVRQDPAALMALYDRHGRLAFALAYRILGDPGAAEEAVQDAFMLVWRRAATFVRFWFGKQEQQRMANEGRAIVDRIRELGARLEGELGVDS